VNVSTTRRRVELSCVAKKRASRNFQAYHQHAFVDVFLNLVFRFIVTFIFKKHSRVISIRTLYSVRKYPIFGISKNTVELFWGLYYLATFLCLQHHTGTTTSCSRTVSCWFCILSWFQRYRRFEPTKNNQRNWSFLTGGGGGCNRGCPYVLTPPNYTYPSVYVQLVTCTRQNRGRRAVARCRLINLLNCFGMLEYFQVAFKSAEGRHWAYNWLLNH